MKKLMVIAVVLLLAGSVSVNAGGRKAKREAKKQLTEEMVTKYDANKDGKVDKDEAAKISEADQKKMKDGHVSLDGSKTKAEGSKTKAE